MAEPYSINIFMPEGDPSGIKIIERPGRTGKIIAGPRGKFEILRERAEFKRGGVYILEGIEADTESDTERPLLYIGQSDTVVNRLNKHNGDRDFWTSFLLIVPGNDDFNSAHVRWLEYALIQRALEVNFAKLENIVVHNEPILGEADLARMQNFLKELLLMFPLVGQMSFSEPTRVVKVAQTAPLPKSQTPLAPALDTLIVPAREIDGFQDVFIKQNAWWQVRIAPDKLDKIKYIAAYRKAPIAAITHYAPVADIVTFGNDGKYKLIFSEPAKLLPQPITYDDDVPQGTMQSTKYTSLAKLLNSKKISDLFPFGQP